MIALVIISIIVSLVGLLFLSNATTGVGILAFAILLAVYARIAQAHEHHSTLPHVREQAARVQAEAAAYLNAPPRKPTAIERYAVAGFLVVLGLLVVAVIARALFFS